MRVYQLGPSGDQPGGMAQVVNKLLEWTDDRFRVTAIVSTRRRHDPLAPALALRALASLLVGARPGRIPRPVLVAHLSEGGSFVREGGLLLIAGLLGYGTIAHLHGADFESFATARPRLVRLVLGQAHAIATLTDGARSTVKRLLGDDAPIHIVRNPVDIPLDKRDKQRLVLFAGEVGFRKGADVLAQAWNDLPAAVVDGWELVVAGPIAAPVIASTLRTSRSVTVTGSLPHDVILDRFLDAAVVVLPSRAEALPMTILEAMAAGCVVVATSVGQIADVVRPGATGVLVSPDDPRSLRDGLAAVMADQDNRRRLGENAAQVIEQQFSSRVVRTSLNDLWAEVALQ